MSLPTCPVDCTSTLPVLDFDLCAPEINAGQISKFYFTTIGNPLASVASEAEWDSRLDNDSVSATAIRALIGIGSLAAAEVTEKEVSLGRKIFGKRSYTLPFKVDESNNTNHAAFRVLQCNTGNYLGWFETRDGKLYGGNSGIEVKIKADIVIPEAYDDIIIYQLDITWEAQFMPEVIDSPIVSTTGDVF